MPVALEAVRAIQIELLLITEQYILPLGRPVHELPRKVQAGEFVVGLQ